MPTWIKNNNNQYQTHFLVEVTSQNINNNTSNVNVILVAKKLSGNGYWSANAGLSRWDINVDGQIHGGNFTYDFRNYNDLYFIQTQLTIAHNEDGGKAIRCIGGVTLDGIGTASFDNTITLPTIPRASSLTDLPTSFNIGTNINFNILRASNVFKHTVYLRRPSDDLYITIATDLTTSGTLVPTNTAQDVIYKMIPNSTEITLGIRIITFNGDNLVGFKDYPITAKVPESVVPSFNTITHSENVSDVNTKIGKYVQNISKLNLAIAGAAGAKFSTVTGYKIEVDNQVLNAVSGVTQVIQSKGIVKVKGTVIDSRGRTTTKIVDVNILPYSFPTFTNAVTAIRCNPNGTDNLFGTHVKITFKADAISLKNGTTEKNNITYKISSRVSGNGNYEEKDKNINSGISKNVSVIINTYDVNKVFDLKIDITDQFYTTTTVLLIVRGGVTVQFGKDWVSIGKLYDGNGTLSVGGDIYQNGNKVVDITTIKSLVLDMIYPIGSIYTSISNRNPSTFIGGTWVAFADGRTLVGIDTKQTEFNSVQKTGGQKTTMHAYPGPPINSGNSQNAGWKYIDSVNNKITNLFRSFGGSTDPMRVPVVENVGGTIGDNSGIATEANYFRYEATNLQPYITVYMWRRTA